MFQVLVGFIVHIIPVKSQIVSYFNLEYTRKENIILTLTLTFIPAGLGYIFPGCVTLFGMLGAFFGTTIIVTFPGIMILSHFRKIGKQDYLKFYIIFVWAAVFTVLGFASGINTSYQAWKKFKSS